MIQQIFWKLPIKTISEANCSEHWSKKHKRHKEQKHHIWYQFKKENPTIYLPCTIILTRCGKKLLDDDNLPSSMKWIRDEIANQIFPGLNPGEADSDPSLSWKYKQKIEKSYSIEILFEFDDYEYDCPNCHTEMLYCPAEPSVNRDFFICEYCEKTLII